MFPSFFISPPFFSENRGYFFSQLLIGEDFSMTPQAEIVCPANCPAGYLYKQRRLYPVERLRISSSARHEVDRLRGRTRFCEGCSCVYVEHRSGKKPLGYLHRDRWHSEEFP